MLRIIKDSEHIMRNVYRSLVHKRLKFNNVSINLHTKIMFVQKSFHMMESFVLSNKKKFQKFFLDGTLHAKLYKSKMLDKKSISHRWRHLLTHLKYLCWLETSFIFLF